MDTSLPASAAASASLPASAAASSAGAGEAASSSASAAAPPRKRKSARPPAPSHVFVVTHAQSQNCCGEGGADVVGVYMTATLARGAARTFLENVVPGFSLYFEGSDFSWNGPPDKSEAELSEAELREACEAAGLAVGGAADALRERLEAHKEAARRAELRAELLASTMADATAAALDEAVDEAYEQAEEEKEAEEEAEYDALREAAQEAFFAGADNADEFSGNINKEHWAADGSGTIYAPRGGSCCWGSVPSTVTVTRMKLVKR